MKNNHSIIKSVCLGLGLLTHAIALAQAGIGPAPYCMPTYNATSIPCNQPGASNNAGNTINDFIDSFNTTGGTQNITDNNNGCQTQVLSAQQQNYFYKGCPVYLRVVAGQTITFNFRSGIIFDQGFAVFIDLNQNTLFDLPGERVSAVTGLPTAATWTSCTWVVPAMPIAAYRLRARCAYVTTGGLIDPCNNYSYGETQDYIMFYNANCSALPVELVSFDGEFRNKEARLFWGTATEENSDHFTLERSYDNENFELVSKTPATGTSHTVQTYSATDKEVIKNRIVYYRLKQFDKNKSDPNFSQTITLFLNDKNVGFDMYPNPGNTDLSIVLPDILVGKTLSFGVYDNYGKEVMHSESVISEDNTKQSFDISSLEKGTYFVKVMDPSGDIVMKKVLVKQ